MAQINIKITPHYETSKLVVFSAIASFIVLFFPSEIIFGLCVSRHDIVQLGTEGNYTWTIPILSGLSIYINMTGPNIVESEKSTSTPLVVLPSYTSNFGLNQSKASNFFEQAELKLKRK